MKMVTIPNYDSMEVNQLDVQEMLLLAALTVFAELGFFKDAGDCYQFAVNKFEDEQQEPWFVDHAIEDSIPTVLVYRKQERVATSPALLKIQEPAQ